MHHNTKFWRKKCLVVYKISGQALTIWSFAVTLTLNAVILFFSQDTLASDDVSADQVWLPQIAVILTLQIATTTKDFHDSGS